MKARPEVRDTSRMRSPTPHLNKTVILSSAARLSIARSVPSILKRISAQCVLSFSAALFIPSASLLPGLRLSLGGNFAVTFLILECSRNVHESGVSLFFVKLRPWLSLHLSEEWRGAAGHVKMWLLEFKVNFKERAREDGTGFSCWWNADGLRCPPKLISLPKNDFSCSHLPLSERKMSVCFTETVF